MLKKRLSEKEIDELKEYIFQKQKEYYRRNFNPIKKRNGIARKESNKMLYENMVMVD